MAGKRPVTIMRERQQRWEEIPATLRKLKRYFEITDQHIADGLGLPRYVIRSRLAGESKLQPWEVDGFAAYFGVPAELIRTKPSDEVLRFVLDHGITITTCSGITAGAAA